jgi:hypothetical protein
VGNFGAKRAYEAALKLETMGREADLNGATDVLARLEVEVSRLESALASLTEGLPQGS